MSQSTAVASQLELPTVVLLVDDQPIIAAAVQKMIAGQVGWEFHYCKDATMAVAKALELKPTVILQDLVMPEMDGLDLVKLYREQAALKAMVLMGSELLRARPPQQAACIYIKF